MKKYLLLAVLALSCQAQAANYYFSDCTPGAVSTCVQGSDTSATPSNPATPLRTLTEAIKRFRDAQPGDRLLFAKGGSFDAIGEVAMQNLSSVASNPIIFDSYQPTWYKGKNKPILNQRGEGFVLWFGDGGTPEADAGYIVRNLHLKGDGVTRATGVFINQLASDVLLDSLTFEGLDIGVYCGEKIERVQLKNSQLTNIKHAGILWGCSNSVVENNTFDKTGFGHVYRDHAMYFDNGASGIVRGNTITNSVHFKGEFDGQVFDGSKCTGVVIVGHMQIRDMLIENNKIVEKVKSGGGCWGIALDGGNGVSEGPEGMHNIVIRGNKLVNVGNTGIGCSSCDNFTIENNVLVWEFADDITAIAVPDRVAGAEDNPTTNVTIRNNSIFLKNGGPWSTAIKTADVGTHIVSSNLIYFATTTSANAACFDTTNRTISNFTNFSNNLCFRGSGGARFSWAYPTLAAAQAANPKWNTNGKIVNPQLVGTPTAANGYSMKQTATSVVINAGNAAFCSPTSFDGTARGPNCDIGAYER